MSRRTVEFKRKIAQQVRKNGKVDPTRIIPLHAAKSTGRKTIYVHADGVDEEGKKTKVGTRIKGRASGQVVTIPANLDTQSRLSALCK